MLKWDRLYLGGTSNFGGVFKVRTDGTGYTVLHSFGDQSDPYPRLTTALVQGPDGYLYGSTPYGGTNSNGTVFKLNINGGGYSIIHAFRGSSVGDGQTPNAVAFGQDGALYGTTVYGGANGYNNFGQGAGILFTLKPDGSGYTVLHHFGAGADGLNPQAGLMQAADGAWYGTTSAGGDLNLGTVFRFGLNPFRFTSISRLADKTVLLSLSGSTNTHCRIDVSTNLVHWDTLTNLPDQTGTVQFHDLAAPDFPRRFYRAAQAP